MKRFRLIIIGLLAILFTAFNVPEDIPFLRMLKEKLSEYCNLYPEETIYVQTDKPFYKQGESVWLNAFLINSSTRTPSEISNTVYVEMRDPRGNVVKQIKLFANKGMAKGDLKIDKSVPGGIYTIIAYTRWMKNFGEDRFFKKEIQVQKVITPRLLFKFDFEKKAYGPGDEVSAKLTVTDLKNEIVNNAKIRALIKLDGRITDSVAGNYSNTDTARLNFRLPHNLQTSDGLLDINVLAPDGTTESISRSIPIVLNKIHLELLPEGGDLVENVKSRVAFKALNEFGKGADVSGVVVDETGNTVTTFESFHMGMGAFELTPRSGKTYKVRIQKPSVLEFTLPASLSSGYVLNLQSQEKEKLTWNIYSPVDGSVYLVAQSHGVMYYDKEVSVQKGYNAIEVPLSSFPAGIAVFTLFSKDRVGECERLVFVNKHKRLNISITPDKKIYQPNGMVTLAIKTTDEKGEPVGASLALSAVDDQLLAFADDRQDNILSYFLLSSEVKGKIEEPSFYFNENEPKAEAAIDYLLMTQGWRRFTWHDVLKRPAVNFVPENDNMIQGYVTGRYDKPMQAEVILIEFPGKTQQRRIVKLQTTKEGKFAFYNLSGNTVALFTKKPGNIHIYDDSTMFRMNQDRRLKEIDALIQRPEPEPNVPNALGVIPVTATNQGVPGVTNEVRGVTSELSGELFSIRIRGAATRPSTRTSSGIPLFSELPASSADRLDEVVIVGYGTVQRSVTTSTVSVLSGIYGSRAMTGDIASILSGRVAGLIIQNTDASPGGGKQLQQEGINSLDNGYGDPLILINGNPLSKRLNRNFSFDDIVSSGEIKSISIQKSAQSATLNSRANGTVIDIETYNGNNFARHYINSSKKAYNSKVLFENKDYYSSGSFYSSYLSSDYDYDYSVYRSSGYQRPKNLNTTVCWDPTIVTTNTKGEASLSFFNNDKVTAWRVTAEGITRSGLSGRTEVTYATQLPYSIDAKIPSWLGLSDTLRLPVMVRNNSGKDLNALTVYCQVPRGLIILGTDTTVLSIEDGKVKTVWFTLISKGKGNYQISLMLKNKSESKSYVDRISQKIEVRSVGFPQGVSLSGIEPEQTKTFSVKDMEPGSLQGEGILYTNPVENLFSSAAAILREPHGCFEQVSSSTFPNIMALQYMQVTGQGGSSDRTKARDYIRDGYRKLIAYEIAGGGFEWFGHPLAHAGLTAYGLLEFTEMKKVCPDLVNDRMINRTRDYLMSRRDGNGGFQQNLGGYDQFARSRKETFNAYITYALAETGSKDIDKEYQFCLKEAEQSKDMYRLALMANAAYSLGKTEDYNRLVDYFRKQVAEQGFDNFKVEGSIVGVATSYYIRTYRVETVSLWVVALLKDKPDMGVVSSCIDYLAGNRKENMFGSTQSTMLSLKAMTEYAKKMGLSSVGSGLANIQLNGRTLMLLSFNPGSINKNPRRDVEEIYGFTDGWLTGDNTISLKFENTKKPVPYSVNLRWNSLTPFSSKECPVRLKTGFTENVVQVNNTIRLTVELENTVQEHQPMTVALIGIPAGLSLQPWQLKEMRDKQVFDFYELVDNKLAVFYRGMQPGEKRVLHFDLKADIPGSYRAEASSAYLYYMDEHKYWTEGVKVRVE